jgi:hypothetical protein
MRIEKKNHPTNKTALNFPARKSISSLYCCLLEWRGRCLEKVEHLNDTGSHDDNKKEYNQSLGYRVVLFMLRSLAYWYIASLGNVFVKLLVAIANVTWKRLYDYERTRHKDG